MELTEPILAETRVPLRDAFNGWFVTHEVGWELAIAALAIAYVALGFIVDEAEAERPEIAAAELVLTGIFALEFGSRILAARSRLAYFRGHWIDVIALAPPIRVARVLRLLRLLRLVRAFAGIYRAGMHVHGLARHKGFAWLLLAWLLLAWLGVMAVCSAWLYIAEHGVNKAIDSPFDALWWGVVTLTTVGYGDVTPLTTEGRLAAIGPDAPGHRVVRRHNRHDHELPAKSRQPRRPGPLSGGRTRAAGGFEAGWALDGPRIHKGKEAVDLIANLNGASLSHIVTVAMLLTLSREAV